MKSWAYLGRFVEVQIMDTIVPVLGLKLLGTVAVVLQNNQRHDTMLCCKLGQLDAELYM